MSNLYVYVDPEGKYSALPISVAVGSYDLYEPIDGSEDQINNLVEEEHFKFLHLFVQPTEINDLGYRDTIRRKIELLIPKFIVQNQISNSNVIYDNENTSIPKSVYYDSSIRELSEEDICINTLLKTFCHYKRQSRINNLLNFYPDYGWATNRGVLDDYEVKKIIEYECITNQHYLESLRLVPYYWLNAIERYDADYYSLKNIIKDQPMWWTNYFGNHTMLDSLDDKYLDVYNKCVEPEYSTKFRDFLYQSYGKLGAQLNLSK